MLAQQPFHGSRQLLLAQHRLRFRERKKAPCSTTKIPNEFMKPVEDGRVSTLAVVMAALDSLREG